MDGFDDGSAAFGSKQQGEEGKHARRTGSADDQAAHWDAQPCAPSKEAEFDEEGGANHLAAEPLDEIDRSDGGAAGGQQVVDDENTHAGANRVGVDFEGRGPILEVVVGANGLVGQVPELARRHEAGAEPVDEPGGEKKAAAFHRDDAVHGRDVSRHPIERPAEELGVGQDGRDVLEQDAGAREVGDLADRAIHRLGQLVHRPSDAAGNAHVAIAARMRILLANDDGWNAPGLAALAEGLADIGELFVVAPEHEQSAQSHALTLREPLRVRRTAPGRWAVSGTPADCVYLALHHLLPTPPDLVVSGINHGANLGNDVFYSGTVAAAREACLHGVRAISISLARRDNRPPHWETAVAVARRVVRAVIEQPLPADQHMNVNVPDRACDALRGLRATRLGRRTYEPLVELRHDPRGASYYWIGGPHLDFAEDPSTDGRAVADGFASVTLLETFPGPTWPLTDVRRWTDG